MPALWAGLALFVGGVIGASATAVVIDDDPPAQAVTTVEGSFRSASAAEAERYVDSLENRAVVPGVTEHGYAYAHGFSSSPDGSIHMSADAIEHRTQSQPSSLDSCHDTVRGAC
jgi:hypothetical protein